MGGISEPTDRIFALTPHLLPSLFNWVFCKVPLVGVWGCSQNPFQPYCLGDGEGKPCRLTN